ncbi:hypothetical protein MFFC18_02980 [Mariniblastus fucicola]|uniref:Uncharacterized protein n=1 Tax=Mariniblastus fucicola TaxID=980251 RepID=A0A5B9P699_9BACT|nr:hypothetical protein MFFC18_02980 [Mariniblastus fucicola]
MLAARLKFLRELDLDPQTRITFRHPNRASMVAVFLCPSRRVLTPPRGRQLQWSYDHVLQQARFEISQ